MNTAGEDPLERRRDELLAIVYGPAGEPGDEVVAELAALERELAARRGEADRAAAPASTEPPEALDHATTDNSGAAVAGGRLRRLRRFRPLAIASAVLMLIAAGFVLIGPVRGLLSPARGLGVFERPQTAEELLRADPVADAAGLEPGDAETLRAVGRLFGHEFWVHRDAHDRVCLLSRRQFWFDWIDECVSLAEFEEFGLTRRIAGDDIRHDARPPRIGRDDAVLVRWGSRSLDVEWTVEPPSEIDFDDRPRRPAS
ncbi:hypothetical protein [Agromyces bauzanensis]